jgi:2-oxoglutarate ferredoxin oxidoreductase subunit gamma
VTGKCQIILSGVGGQGLIAGGSILGEAATIFDGKNASLVSSYGIETRGTFTKSDIIISDQEIYYPEVIKEDVVLSLAQVAYNKYVDVIKEDALLVYDSGMVTDTKESKAEQFGFPFTEMARELGHVAAANIIAIGFIVKKTGIVKPESLVEAIKDKFAGNEKAIDLNVNAFNKGLSLE